MVSTPFSGARDVRLGGGWLGSRALPSLVRSFVETGKDGT